MWLKTGLYFIRFPRCLLFIVLTVKHNKICKSIIKIDGQNIFCALYLFYMNKKTQPKSTRQMLLSHIKAYLKNHPHMSEEGFGWVTIKDCALIDRLSAGKDITTRKLDDILRFLSAVQQPTKEE